ncbi:MAG: hypothetical protein IPG79_06765 [Saprospiraceae bacterium]|nr:hypothetical protein [Saprospiraceae bacterium]
MISESNFKEADYKCDGLANNYPQYDVILSQSVGSICGENIQIQKNLVEKSVTKTLCSGVTYTERTRLDCK